MRIILTFLIVFSATNLNAQVRNEEATKGYFKAAGELFLPKDDGESFFGGSFGAGAIFQETISLGAEIGVYKIKDFKNAVIPIGGQIGICNFSAKKIAPIVNFGVYYPLYSEKINISPSAATGAVYVISETKGEIQFKALGGVLFRAGKKLRIIFSGGYNNVKFRSKISSLIPTPEPSRTTTSFTTFKVESWITSFSFMLN